MKSPIIDPLMFNRLAMSVSRVVNRVVNCFKAAEHFGDSRKGNTRAYRKYCELLKNDTVFHQYASRFDFKNMNIRLDQLRQMCRIKPLYPELDDFNGCLCNIGKMEMDADTLKIKPNSLRYFRCPIHSSDVKSAERGSKRAKKIKLRKGVDFIEIGDVLAPITKKAKDAFIADTMSLRNLS